MINKYKNIEVKKDVLKSVVKNIERNELIVQYYELYGIEKGLDIIDGNVFNNKYEILRRKRERLVDCNNLWWLDVFDKSKIKNFKTTNLCRDKFCNNCKKVKQASRMARYIPKMEKYRDYLYHLVLTVPNCSGENLKDEVNKMAVCFRKLIRIIRGDYKKQGFGWLSSLGYQGAVRSLEITFTSKEYHPHYHIALVLRPSSEGLKYFDKKYINSYSYSYGNFKTYFSHLEIIVQKIWYLLYNNIRVTRDSIKNLELGYSVKIDKFKDSEYQELFKYLIKGCGQDEDMTYYNFKFLYEALYRKKQIQGYGCLYQIKDDDDEEMFEILYDEFIKALYEEEEPRETSESPEALIKDNEYLLISRKTYINYLRSIGDL